MLLSLVANVKVARVVGDNNWKGEARWMQWRRQLVVSACWAVPAIVTVATLGTRNDQTAFLYTWAQG